MKPLYDRLPSEIYRWQKDTVVCIASGPSLTQEDVDYCRGRAKVITVNTSFRLAPWADIHYSSDEPWWELYWDEVQENTTGDIWTGNEQYGIKKKMNTIPFIKRGQGVCQNPKNIFWGGNSGFCALQLAYKTGAKKIILLGYDMKWPRDEDGNIKKHWFGDHPTPLSNCNNFPFWLQHFKYAAKDFKSLGVEVVNCTRESDLQCFRKESLISALGGDPLSRS